jgi:uncharacterized phiE125 gp8 family phage protein
MVLRTVTGPAAEQKIWSLETLRDEGLRGFSEDEDTYIETLIDAATHHIEQACSYRIITQQVSETFCNFPLKLELELWPVQAINSFTYYDKSDQQQNVDPAIYRQNLHRRPALIHLKSGESYPDVIDDRTDAVEITYTVGFGDTFASVPADLKMAAFFLISHWYNNREPVNVAPGAVAAKVPKTLDYLLNTHRAWRVA